MKHIPEPESNHINTAIFFYLTPMYKTIFFENLVKPLWLLPPHPPHPAYFSSLYMDPTHLTCNKYILPCDVWFYNKLLYCLTYSPLISINSSTIKMSISCFDGSSYSYKDLIFTLEKKQKTLRYGSTGQSFEQKLEFQWD